MSHTDLSDNDIVNGNNDDLKRAVHFLEQLTGEEVKCHADNDGEGRKLQRTSCFENMNMYRLLSELQDVCRTVYRYFSKSPKKVILCYVYEMKKLLYEHLYHFGIDLDRSSYMRFITDTRFVFRIVKENRETLRIFLQNELLLISLIGNNEIYLGMLLTPETIRREVIIKDQIKKILSSAVKEDIVRSFCEDDLYLHYYGPVDPDPEQINAFDLMNYSDYISYMVRFVNYYKRFRGKPILLDENSKLFNEIIDVIHDQDTMSFQMSCDEYDSMVARTVRSFKDIVYHIEFCSGVSLDIREYERKLLLFADEELIIRLYEKGVFIDALTEKYISVAAEEKRFFIIPCLTAYL